jgi:hypothetical protein
MSMMELLKEYEAAAEQKARADIRLELDDAHRVLDKAREVIDEAIDLCQTARDATDTVRQQRDATLELVKRYEHERFAYRVQGYAIGVILGVLITYGVMS